MKEYVKTIFQKIGGKVLKKFAVPSTFGFPKFSLNSKIEEKNVCCVTGKFKPT
jgi:hypothetical protein